MLTLLYLLALLSYAYCIAWSSRGINKLKASETKIKGAPFTRFSIVIAARNEEENITELFATIAKLKYPKSHFEIIIINDHSTDNTLLILNELKEQHPLLSIQIIDAKKEGIASKKEAITLGVQKASYPWILTTDADVLLPEEWLQSIHNHIEHYNTPLIAAPVACISNNSILQNYQQLDFLSLQGITMGGFGNKHPFLCNGANMGFTKELFKVLQGYKGNAHISSGDDVFLLQKAIEDNTFDVGYIYDKNAIVTTKPVLTLKQIYTQRSRWASKTGSQNNIIPLAMGVITTLCSSLLILGIPLVLLGYISLFEFIGFVTFKGIIDYLFLKKVGRLFQQHIVATAFIPSFLFYPFLNIAVVLGTLGSSPQWKGRKTNR